MDSAPDLPTADAPGRLNVGRPIAIIDIGSNSVRLVAYEGLTRAPTPIYNEKVLAGLGRHQELGIYAQGAVRNGVSVDEIKEILIHVTSYCGTPAGRQSFVAVHQALGDIGALTD